MDFQLLKRRRTLALTIGVTIVTVSGTLIGATLKSRQQLSDKEERQKQQQQTETPGIYQQIALLESTRAQLVKQREVLESKIAEVGEKAKRRQEWEKEKMEKRRELGMNR